MKIYEKPSVEFQNIVSSEKLSSLNEWLGGAGSDYQQAGITTYLIES